METYQYIVLLGCIASVYSADCPDRWVAFDDSCYLFGNHAVTFHEAEEYCRQHNAHLVEINTDRENLFIGTFLRDVKPHDFWLGMTDGPIAGTWKWYTSSLPVEVSGWGPNQPQSTGSGENCAAMNTALDHQWANTQCTANHNALCELSDLTSPVVG